MFPQSKVPRVLAFEGIFLIYTMNMSNSIKSDMPFAHDQGEEIGSGYESIVRALGKDWVIKEVNPTDEQGEPLRQEYLDWARSPERSHRFTEEQRKLEEIFGLEHFARSYFVLGEDEEGNKGYIIIQRRVDGRTAESLIGDVYKTKRELVFQNRDEFMEIVWGAKKAFIEFGVPPDLHLGNLVREDKTGRMVMVDPGSPREEHIIVFGISTPRTQDAIGFAYRRLEQLSRLEGYLRLSAQERHGLDTEYGIAHEQYVESFKKLEGVRESMGVSREQIEEFIRSRSLEAFLEYIVGEDKKVNATAIVRYVNEKAGENTIPEKTQKLLAGLAELPDDLKLDAAGWERKITELFQR